MREKTVLPDKTPKYNFSEFEVQRLRLIVKKCGLQKVCLYMKTGKTNQKTNIFPGM